MTSHRGLALAIVGMLGCSSTIALTSGGQQVQYIASGAETPEGCRFISDVAIGIPPDAARPASEAALIVLMRNKAAELGGNHVVMEWSQQRAGTNSPHYVGRARAYACTPPREPQPTPIDEGETAAPEGEAAAPSP